MFSRQRCRQRFLDAPLQAGDATQDCALRNPNTRGPFRRAHCFAAERQMSRQRRVVHLLSLRGPSTVMRSVRAVVVLAIEAVFGRWLRSHVLQELAKVGSPFGADRDAARSVKLIATRVCVQAPRLHCLPNSVFRSPGSSVRPLGRWKVHEARAAAALRVTFGEVPRHPLIHDVPSSTVAQSHEATELVDPFSQEQTAATTDKTSNEEPTLRPTGSCGRLRLQASATASFACDRAASIDSGHGSTVTTADDSSANQRLNNCQSVKSIAWIRDVTQAHIPIVLAGMECS